jgi:hypothetical protein
VIVARVPVTPNPKPAAVQARQLTTEEAAAVRSRSGAGEVVKPTSLRQVLHFPGWIPAEVVAAWRKGCQLARGDEQWLVNERIQLGTLGQYREWQ